MTPTYRVRLSPVCSRVRCEPSWHLGPQWAAQLRDYDLWFVEKGRGTMQTDTARIVLQPGVCVWMRPGGHYEASHDPARPLTVSCIHFKLANRPAGFRPPFETLQAADVPFVEAMVRRIIRLRATATPAAQSSAASLFGSLLGELEREARCLAETPVAGGTARHHREVIHQLAAEIRGNAGHPHAIAQLARQAGYSVDHFSRIFAQITGSRPQDFIIAARLARARELLAQTGLTVSQIAETLGYTDVFFFSRQFRRHAGQPPTRFRASLGQTHARAAGKAD